MLKEIAFKFDTHTAIVNSPDTEMKEIFLEGLHVLQTHPDIPVSIQADIDARAIEKKRLRLADKAYVDAMTGSVFGDRLDALSEQTVTLKDGRPRLLDAEAVFFMKLLRGHLSSVTSIVAVDRLMDSQLVQAYFQSKGQGVPAATTLHDALSALSPKTDEVIFDAVLKTALAHLQVFIIINQNLFQLLHTPYILDLIIFIYCNVYFSISFSSSLKIPVLITQTTHNIPSVPIS